MPDRNGYIGRAPSDSSVTVARQTFQPTSDTSTFVFTSGYDVGYLDVYVNGAKLINAIDYQATDGQNITITEPVTSSEVVEFVAYKAFNISNVITTSSGDFTVDDDLTVGDDLIVGGDVTASGIVTATQYYGDGSNLTGISYNDITDKPTIPTNNNELTNGAGYVTPSGTVALAQGLTGVPDINAGVITATSFYGNGSGITGLANTDRITAESLVVLGISTLTNNVNVGGGNIVLDSNGSATFIGTVTADNFVTTGVGVGSTGAGGAPAKDSNVLRFTCCNSEDCCLGSAKEP